MVTKGLFEKTLKKGAIKIRTRNSALCDIVSMQEKRGLPKFFIIFFIAVGLMVVVMMIMITCE